MCLASFKQVIGLNEKSAVVTGGQIVRLGSIKPRVGDYLEVYADIAISKKLKTEVKSSLIARKGNL